MATPARGPGRRTLRRRRTGIPAVALALGIAVAGCGAASAGQGRSTAPVAHPATRHATAARPAASCPAQVLSRMTEAQRVGQLFLVGLAADQLDPATAAAIRSGHFGSVLFGTTGHAGVAGTRSVTNAVHWLATAQATAGVRFFVAANQEGGQVQQLQGTGFPAMPAA